MVDKAAACVIVHVCIDLAIYAFEQEAFENILPDEKVKDKNDADYQSTEWGESRYGLEWDVSNVRTCCGRLHLGGMQEDL
jgi:hypothetical protein